MKALLSILAYLIIWLIGSLLLAGCANERSFMRYHDRNPNKAALHCGIWFPPKVIERDSTSYVPGKTVVSHDTTYRYVNCDSLENEKQGNPAVNTNYVQVPCPPDSTRVDTFYQYKYVQVENTAMIEGLQGQVNDLTAKNNTLSTQHKKEVKTIAILIAIVIGLLAWIFRKPLAAMFKSLIKLVIP